MAQELSRPLHHVVAQAQRLSRFDLSTAPVRLRRRLVQTYRDTTTRRVQVPSSNYKVLEASRTRKQLRAYGLKDPAFSIDAKDEMHAWLRQLGVRTATVVASYDRPEQIAWDSGLLHG